jgi:predicted nucleic acid-binding protein
MATVKPSVYIETSVISALLDERKDPIRLVRHESSLKWWSEQSQFFELYTSEAVYFELANGPSFDSASILAYLDHMTRLPVDAEATYQEQKLMPREEAGDAVHLAVASVHEIEYLLTWNCQHLANTNKTRHLQTINRRLGLFTPVLLTPDMLVREDSHEDQDAQ